MTATGQRILIVEDEHHLAEGLRFNLEAEGYGADVVETDGGSVGEVLNSLKSRAAGIEGRLFKGEKLNRFVNVYLNDEDVRFRSGFDTPVREGDEITVVAAIAGG